MAMPCAYVVADDLTGALDTGVVFVRSHVPAILFSNIEDALACREPGVVVVINCNYRHMHPDGARSVLKPVAVALASLGARCYIKTDSGLRGNIGPAFEVFIKAYACEPLPFVPAYPALGRTTKDGLHYIQGIPVGQSAFAKDPLNPVQFSHIQQVLHSDASIAVHMAHDAEIAPVQAAVTVYDAQTEKDLSAIAKAFGRRGVPRIAAGCAGFAAYLPALWALPHTRITKPKLKGSIAVFSGTASSTSLTQITHAIENSIPWQRINVEEIFSMSLHTAASYDPLPFVKLLSKKNIAILTTTQNEADIKKANALMAKAGLDRKAGCTVLTQYFAQVCVQLLHAYPHILPFVFGGDTLVEIITLLHFRTILPKFELFPGIVLSQIADDLGTHYMITKSGHFGEEDLILQLASLQK